MSDQRPLQRITQPKVLIVEGEDEKRLFSELLAYLDLRDVEIRELAESRSSAGISKP